MTLYFAGGEDTSFIMVGSLAFGTFTCGVLNNSNQYRPAFARAAIYAVPSSGYSNPATGYIATPSLGALTSFWVHARCCNINNFSPALDDVILSVQDSGGLSRILVLGTGTAGQIKLCKCDASGTITTLVTSAAGAITPNDVSSPRAFDLFVNYAASGQVKLYVDGVVIADTGTGMNVTTNSVTSLAIVQFAGVGNGSGGGYGSAWSEVIVQDTSTLGMALQTLPPLAAGTTQSWSPSTVGNIDSDTINDANLIAATAANSLSEWTVATALPSGFWDVLAVVQEARVLVGATGPQHFEWLTRTSDGSDHVTGSVAPTTSFANYSHIWPTNPHTSAAWNAGELINAGIESLT